MNVVKNDINREADILALCKSVLDASTIFYDDPNGPYTHTCPFCYSKCYEEYCELSDIHHASDCAYVIAKDLSTNLL